MPDSGSFAARTSLALAAIAAVAVLLLPLGRSVTEQPQGVSGPAAPATSERTTLLAEQGAWVIGLVAFPVALAAIPVVGERIRPGSRALRVVSAGALWLFVVAGLGTIGWFFAPSAIAMTLAAASRRPRAPQQG